MLAMSRLFKRDAVAADLAVHDQRRLAVRHQADIGRGAAHVERDQVLRPDQAGGIDAAGDPAGRSRQHGAGREPSGLGDRRDAAMRLDDQGRPLIAGLGEPGFEPRQIARQHRADIGVDDRRRDPLELLDLRQDLARTARHRRRAARDRSASARRVLVARVAPGVQVADRDRLDLFLLQHGDRGVERGRVERDLDPAVGAHPLAHRQAQPARHELLGRRHAQIVAVVLQPLAHLDDVAMAFGGKQAEAGALAFEQRVGRDGRAVHDAVGLRQQRGAVEAQALRRAVRDRRARRSTGPAASRALLQASSRRPASIATRSVNVPPTSMPMRYIGYAPTLTLPRKRGRGYQLRRPKRETPSPASGGGSGWGYTDGQGPSVSAIVLKHAGAVLENLVVPEAQHAPALLAQSVRRGGRVRRRRACWPPSISIISRASIQAKSTI